MNEKGEKKRTATEGLMWLLRGLSFTCKALQAAQANPSEELSTAFTKSYEGTLKKFHNFVVKGIFSVSVLIRPFPGLIRVVAIVGVVADYDTACSTRRSR